MSSNESPPSYHSPDVFFNEKCPNSTAYHLTLERCKESVLLESGRYVSSGFLDDLNIAITIPSHHTWPQVREQVWSRFQAGWPAILGKAELKNFSMGINMQYRADDGKIRGRVQLLTDDEDGLWDLAKRGSINVVRFHAHCAPYRGVAAGEVKRRRNTSFQELNGENGDSGSRKESTDKDKGKVKHHCVLQ